MKTLSLNRATPGHPVGEVDLAVELEALLLLGGQDPVEKLSHRLGIELRRVGQQLDRAPHADRGMRADREVQVGSPALHRVLEP